MSKIEKVTLILKNGVREKNLDEWHKEANQYTATLKYDGRQMTVDFFTPKNWSEKPKVLDILSSLFIIASRVENSSSYSDFCSNIGHPESKDMEKIYNDSLRTNKRLKKLLGDDYQKFYNIASRH